MQQNLAQSSSLNHPHQRAAVQRVQISDATPTQPPHMRVFFRDVEAAKQGHLTLISQLPYLAQDSRTSLDLTAPMPTLTYPVI